MSRIFTPPYNISERDFDKPTIFLAGSIELGVSDDWQTDIANYFKNIGYNVFNPRRPDWDNSIKQEFTDPKFYQQVKWELNALDVSDIILMYFDPKTKSPISLLELGLFAASGKMHVICPEPFWRKGNVDIVCDAYRIPTYKNLIEFRNKYK